MKHDWKVVGFMGPYPSYRWLCPVGSVSYTHPYPLSYLRRAYPAWMGRQGEIVKFQKCVMGVGGGCPMWESRKGRKRVGETVLAGRFEGERERSMPTQRETEKSFREAGTIFFSFGHCCAFCFSSVNILVILVFLL